MVMLLYDFQNPTYQVVEHGRTIGKVVRPIDAKPFGRWNGTVYLARRVRRSNKVGPGGPTRKGMEAGS
jgi:hypothetical protein